MEEGNVERQDEHGSDPVNIFAVQEWDSVYTAFCVMCEQIESFQDRTVTLGRIANRWTVHDALPPFAITFRIAIGFRGLTPNMKEPIRILFLRERDNLIFSMSDPEVVSDSTELNLYMNVDALAIDEFGAYRLEVVHEDREIGRFPFRVERARA